MAAPRQSADVTRALRLRDIERQPPVRDPSPVLKNSVLRETTMDVQMPV